MYTQRPIKNRTKKEVNPPNMFLKVKQYEK